MSRDWQLFLADIIEHFTASLMTMTTLTLQLDDTKAAAFQEKARRIGREPEQLLTQFIDDLIEQPDTDFEQAVDHVLTKNRELYRRLA